MKIKLLVEGGAMQPGPALSQKIGPLGLNMGQIIQKINDATKDFKGLKVPVELDVDTGTKESEVQVFSPPVSELLKKELGLEKGSGIQKRLYLGNLGIEQIVSIAKTKLPNLLAKDLKAAVKTVVGTCTSLGILVESKLASEIGEDIDAGKYDKEISQEITEISEEKKKSLGDYFNKVKGEQEKVIEKEEAEKQAEEEQKGEEEEKEGEKKEPAEKK